MTTTVVISTNAEQVTPVTIPDMGVIIPAYAGSDTFTDRQDILDISKSADLLTLATDDAFGADDSTLMVDVGTGIVPQADVAIFLINLLTAEATKEIFYQSVEVNADFDCYRVMDVAASASHRMNFDVPWNFIELVELTLVFSPTSGAAGAGKNIDLTSDYGKTGESVNNHTSSDTTSTYDTGTADFWESIDISPLYPSLTAGDRGGILIDHMAIGGSLRYLGITLKYR